MAIGSVLLAGVIGSAGLAPAQSNDDVDALDREIVALFEAAKFAEALPLVRRFAELTKARYGEGDQRYDSRKYCVRP